MPAERDVRRGPKRIIQHIEQEMLVRFTHSRLLTPPPTSPLGYQLQLIGNGPRHLTPNEHATAQKKVKQVQEDLQDQGAVNNTKVNITSIHVASVPQPDGSIQEVIQYTTAPSFYYEHRAAIDRTTPYETARKLTHSGATLLAITGDGMIALSSRREQQIFSRTWDSTAQGSWDGKLQESTSQQILVPPTEDKARAHILKETEEEVGIPSAVLHAPDTKLSVLGVSEDAVKKHWDIIWLLRLPKNITAQDVRLFHDKVKSGEQDPMDPIAGHLTFIQANPRAIETFLTRMRSPSAPIAREALLLTGYVLRLEELKANGYSQKEAAHKANKWKESVERQIASRQFRVDIKARRYRRAHIISSWEKYAVARVQHAFRRPGAAEKMAASQTDLRIYRRRQKGYDPHTLPHDQGLPDTKEELMRNGFIPSDGATPN